METTMNAFDSTSRPRRRAFVAGGLAAKRVIPAGAGSFPTTGGLWIGLLAAVILIVGGLTFLPALVLGPISDQAQVAAGTML